MEEDGQERGREQGEAERDQKELVDSITLMACPLTIVSLVTTSPSQPQRKLPRNGPSPRISRLNNPWALERTFFGKFSSTKI
jgi:hypothetical protein